MTFLHLIVSDIIHLVAGRGIEDESDGEEEDSCSRTNARQSGSEERTKLLAVRLSFLHKLTAVFHECANSYNVCASYVTFGRLMTQTNAADPVNKADDENDGDNKQKETKSPRAETSPHADHSPATPSGQPAYVPYALYSKLLERVSIEIIRYIAIFSFQYVAR